MTKPFAVLASSLALASFPSLLPALAAFVASAASPASAADVYCSDLKAVYDTSGWSTLQKDKSIDNKPITLGGKVYPKGLGIHSPSEVDYNLAGKYATFSADAGIDDETAGQGSSEFEVFADDSLLFKSTVLRGKMAPVKISVSVAGKNKLKLVTTIGGDNYNMDDVDWGGAVLAEKTVAVLPAKPAAVKTQGNIQVNLLGELAPLRAASRPPVLLLNAKK